MSKPGSKRPSVISLRSMSSSANRSRSSSIASQRSGYEGDPTPDWLVPCRVKLHYECQGKLVGVTKDKNGQKILEMLDVKTGEKRQEKVSVLHGAEQPVVGRVYYSGKDQRGNYQMWISRDRMKRRAKALTIARAEEAPHYRGWEAFGCSVWNTIVRAPKLQSASTTESDPKDDLDYFGFVIKHSKSHIFGSYEALLLKPDGSQMTLPVAYFEQAALPAVGLLVFRQRNAETWQGSCIAKRPLNYFGCITKVNKASSNLRVMTYAGREVVLPKDKLDDPSEAQVGGLLLNDWGYNYSVDTIHFPQYQK